MQPIQTLREFASTEERGVSSVIGVVLMVAVAVILAAVIATFALGIGNQTENTTPNVQFDVEEKTVDTGGGPADVDHNAVVFKHQSGKSIDASNIKIEVNGKQAYTLNANGKLVEPLSSDAEVFNGGQFKVGNKVRVMLYDPSGFDLEAQLGNTGYSDDNSCAGNEESDSTSGSEQAFSSNGGLPCSATIHEGDTVRILFTGGDGNPGVITTYELDEPAA